MVKIQSNSFLAWPDSVLEEHVHFNDDFLKLHIKWYCAFHTPLLNLAPLVHFTVDKAQTPPQKKLLYNLDRIESCRNRVSNTIWQDLLAVVCQLVNVISAGSETTGPIWSGANDKHLSSNALSVLVKRSSCRSSSDSASAGCSGLSLFHSSLWGHNSSHLQYVNFFAKPLFQRSSFVFFFHCLWELLSFQCHRSHTHPHKKVSFHLGVIYIGKVQIWHLC